jgi:methionine biosynthesis protein MetW
MPHDQQASSHFQAIWRRKLADASSASYIPGVNDRVDNAIKAVIGGNALLDVGCGTGILLEKLQGRFMEVRGVDISEVAVAVARERGLDVLAVDLNNESLPYPSGFFDTVTILSALQYFYEPDRALGECERVLRKRGSLLLSVPNMRAIWRLARLLVAGSFPRVSMDGEGYDGGTLHYFAYANLAELLARNGFRILSAHGIFCRPTWISRLADAGFAGVMKREFFGAEIFVKAQKVD